MCTAGWKGWGSLWIFAFRGSRKREAVCGSEAVCKYHYKIHHTVFSSVHMLGGRDAEEGGMLGGRDVVSCTGVFRFFYCFLFDGEVQLSQVVLELRGKPPTKKARHCLVACNAGCKPLFMRLCCSGPFTTLPVFHRQSCKSHINHSQVLSQPYPPTWQTSKRHLGCSTTARTTRISQG